MLVVRYRSLTQRFGSPGGPECITGKSLTCTDILGHPRTSKGSFSKHEKRHSWTDEERATIGFHTRGCHRPRTPDSSGVKLAYRRHFQRYEEPDQLFCWEGVHGSPTVPNPDATFDKIRTATILACGIPTHTRSFHRSLHPPPSAPHSPGPVNRGLHLLSAF